MPAPRRDLRGGYSSTWRGSSQLGAEASPRPCRELPARRSLLPGGDGRVPDGRAPRGCHGHARGRAVAGVEIVGSRRVPGLAVVPRRDRSWGGSCRSARGCGWGWARARRAAREERRRIVRGLPRTARARRPCPGGATAPAASRPSNAASSTPPCAAGPSGAGRPCRSGGGSADRGGPGCGAPRRRCGPVLGGPVRPGCRTDRRRGEPPPGSSPPRARSAPLRRP